MDPDKALVRTVEDGRTNLAVGEPFFLHRPLKALIVEPKPSAKMRAYPPYGGMPELLEVLQDAHPNQHVVVTTGAKQALLAAFYALKRKRLGLTGVYHQAPHWPTYPTLAALSGLHFLADGQWPEENYIKVVSSPNNPDGRTINSASMIREKCNVWDAAYAHSVYGWDGVAPDHEISVWSAAKLLGLSGHRVGWLLTQDPVLAEHAADYVEKTTSGVNVYSQLKIAATLRWMRGNPVDTARAYSRAHAILGNNGAAFENNFGDACTEYDGFPKNGCGMFAWFRPRSAVGFDRACGAAGVVTVHGEACGGPHDWYRMSLGVETDVLSRALEGLRRYTLFGDRR